MAYKVGGLDDISLIPIKLSLNRRINVPEFEPWQVEIGIICCARGLH